MLRPFFLCLLLPLPAYATDSAEANDHWFTVVLVGVFLLYTVIKQPEWFRKRAKRYVNKHEKYVAWIREQSEYSKSLSDDDVWVRIRLIGRKFYWVSQEAQYLALS
jgi:hypothetical protein